MMFLFLFVFNLGALVDYTEGSGNYTAYALTTGVDYGPAVRFSHPRSSSFRP